VALPSTPTRVLVVSHPSVLTVNQLPYERLRAHGWDPWLVVPSRWRHEYSSDRVFAPERLPALAGRISTRRVILPGRVQRHVYATEISRILGQVAPEIAFLEAEPTSLAAFQWGWALQGWGIPFAVQVDENLRRPYPAIARLIRRWSTARAAFAAARSPTAARLLNELAPSLPTPLVPHHVPEWTQPAVGGERPFTVGYAGRFVPEKGLGDLVQAISLIAGARARLVGNGPMLGELQRQAAAGAPIDIVTDATHATMQAVYVGFDVLVLPSRTTPTWAEQFGRVLVEALSCGVPVVGSSSGEIPWVVESTGGGVVFPEGDVDALRRALVALRDDPGLRDRLASSGRAAVQERFSVPAVAGALSAALRSALEVTRGP